MNTKSSKDKIKKMLNKSVILYISIGINLVFFICAILGMVNFDNKKMGYIGEWYGRARIIPSSMMKDHTRKMTQHFKDLKQVLLQEEFNIKAFTLAVSNINEEKMLFNKEIESIMLERFQKMTPKQRQRFVEKIENRKVRKANIKKKKQAKKENKKQEIDNKSKASN